MQKYSGSGLFNMLENYTKLIIYSFLDLGPVADLHTFFSWKCPFEDFAKLSESYGKSHVAGFWEINCAYSQTALNETQYIRRLRKMKLRVFIKHRDWGKFANRLYLLKSSSIENLTERIQWVFRININIVVDYNETHYICGPRGIP